ncbi:hypothetical protein OCHUTO_0643 [Orientia chuto str. Dubai]|uniref:LepB N-terminal domain-containing protein n=1 Tax=Orientia chuto str. Dubai TaxID=1359168 RepID=A0A0F3MKM3_9RICK|nr:hypothetical protein [Candidatus Orientia mediorientalis]KJV56022.1 hypothetical protein OCHUTO_0643 [Orientia chuto str. Dubai]
MKKNLSSKTTKIVNEDLQKIETLLRDKSASQQSNFVPKGVKQGGVSKGYLAIEKSSNDTFLLKEFFRSEASAIKHSTNMLCCVNSKKLQQAQIDMRDAIQQFIVSDMYQLLLYDRAPKEELVVPDQSNQDLLYLRSKFLKNTATLSEFSGLKGKTHINPNSQELKNLEGFEKVIASCHVLGDLDYHAANVMVQDGKFIAKVDHGRSCMQFYTGFANMVDLTNEKFERTCNYNSAIQAGNLSFSVKKYHDSLSQMLTQLDENQIDNIVEQKVAKLKEAGFDPTCLTVLVRFDGNKFTSTSIDSYSSLAKFYQDNLKQNLQNMQEIVEATAIICKFSNVSSKFMQGGWLKSFADATEKNPILYAHNNNIEIDNLSVLEWVIENKYKIKHSIGYVTHLAWKKQWQKGSNNKWQEITQCVLKQKKNIVESNAAYYIIKSNSEKVAALMQKSQNMLKKESKSSSEEISDDKLPSMPTIKNTNKSRGI